MISVEPQLGTKEVTFAVFQEQYDPLTVALFLDTESGSPVIVSRWKLSDEEKQAISEGEDVWIGLSTFGASPQPLMIQVGAKGLRPEGRYSNFAPFVDASS